MSQIIGYTFNADNYRAEWSFIPRDNDLADLVEAMIAKGVLAPAAREVAIEEYGSFEGFLDFVADTLALDREDEFTFDSGDFPKVILAGMEI